MFVQRFILFSVLFLFSGNIFAQNNSDKLELGKNIIKSARENIFKGQKAQEIKSIQIKTSMDTLKESVSQVEGKSDFKKSNRETIETEISFALPHQIKTVAIIYGKVNPAENYSKMESIFDGTDYARSSDIISNGKRIDLSALIASMPSSAPESVKKQTEVVINHTPEKKDFLEDVWINMFPLLLDFPWDSTIEYIYLGKAQAGDTKANVVEIKSQFKSQIRLFFDEKTQLLLMMTVQSNSGDTVSRKDTHYFSNYEIADGFLVAKKININGQFIDKTRKENENLPTILGRENKTTSEIIVKEFKVNPTFKPNFFEIKKK